MGNGNMSNISENRTAPFGVISIDLGLPSGTKWASCNVGASLPEERGEYFAWGEIEEKFGHEYYLSNYKFREGASCLNLGVDICGTEYDVARQRWGDNWQMPSSDQIHELIHGCTYEWTKLNNVKGGRFTGPNGNTIFLPAAGYGRGLEGIVGLGDGGSYWSGTQHPNYKNDAFDFAFHPNGSFYYFLGKRYYGLSVRPVMKETVLHNQE